MSEIQLLTTHGLMGLRFSADVSRLLSRTRSHPRSARGAPGVPGRQREDVPHHHVLALQLQRAGARRICGSACLRERGVLPEQALQRKRQVCGLCQLRPFYVAGHRINSALGEYHSARTSTHRGNTHTSKNETSHTVVLATEGLQGKGSRINDVSPPHTHTHTHTDTHTGSIGLCAQSGDNQHAALRPASQDDQARLLELLASAWASRVCRAW